MAGSKINSYLSSSVSKLWQSQKKNKEEEEVKKEEPKKEVEQVKEQVTEQKGEAVKVPSSTDIVKEYENKLSSASSAQGDVQKKIDAFLGELNQKYDAFLDRLTGESYKDTDYYNGIVSDYESLGRKMAYNAAASSAADNAGNFNSVGSANAHRQMLSYKNAGEQAARDAYVDELDRYTKGLGDYASDLIEAYGLLSDSTQKSDNFTLSLIEAYENYKKLQDAKEKADKESVVQNSGIGVDLSGGLDKNNATNRYLTYSKMLSQLYPDYAEEIEKIFFSR